MFDKFGNEVIKTININQAMMELIVDHSVNVIALCRSHDLKLGDRILLNVEDTSIFIRLIDADYSKFNDRNLIFTFEVIHL